MNTPHKRHASRIPVDLDKLREHVAAGRSDREIAIAMNLSQGLIQVRRTELGLAGGHGQGGANKRMRCKESYAITWAVDEKLNRLLDGRKFEDVRLTAARHVNLHGREPQYASWTGCSAAMAAGVS